MEEGKVGSVWQTEDRLDSEQSARVVSGIIFRAHDGPR